MRFKTVDAIKDYLEKLLGKIVATGHTLKIVEYFTRMYVRLGYETDDEYEMEQFMASKV